MSKRKELLNLLQSDSFGIFQSEQNKRKTGQIDSTLIAAFEEIQDFVEEHAREPESNMNSILEFKLYSRLKAIRGDANKVKLLKQFDFKNLLVGESVKELSLDDVISENAYGLLESDSERDIFNVKHVKATSKIQPEYLSRRKICKDFHLYKDMFEALHDELSQRNRRLVKYKSTDLKPGKFYVLSGMLLFLKAIDGKVDTYSFDSGERSRFDGRSECIFENGTQSDMLFRSLDKAMQINGYSISDNEDEVHVEGFQVKESDILNGYIYILKSRNRHVQHIQDLYKIGHTTATVLERIKNSKHQSTYLFDEVEVIATFRCVNLDSYRFEQKMHNFFSSVKLDIELTDHSGNSYHPKEWFNVKLEILRDAIQIFVSSGLDEYVYDSSIKQIIKNTLI